MSLQTPARAAILDAIRAAKAAPGFVKKPQKLAAHTVPERGRTAPGGPVAGFISEAEQAGATVGRAQSLAEVPGQILAYLQSRNLSPTLRLAPSVEGLAWDRASGIEVLVGPAVDGDGAGLSRAFAGVAETGTLVLLSGADNPTRLNLLPETHIIVVEAQTIEPAYEDVWKKLRAARSGEAIPMPRTVNWITGPSRTADIEQTLLMGAHGPKALHIVIVGD